MLWHSIRWRWNKLYRVPNYLHEYMKCKAKFKAGNFSLKEEGELENSIDNDVFKEITETNLRQTVR